MAVVQTITVYTWLPNKTLNTTNQFRINISNIAASTISEAVAGSRRGATVAMVPARRE